MFLLFVFLTMFVIFSNTDTVRNSIEEITQHEAIHPILQADILAKSHTYSLKIQASKLDTVKLACSYATSDRVSYNCYIS